MSSLGEHHHVEEGTSTLHKIVGGVVIALILAIAAIYAVETGMFSAQTEQTAKTYPRGL